MPVRAVVFDVGEALVDETRAWGLWAWIGEDGAVPPEAAAVVGSLSELPESLRALG